MVKTLKRKGYTDLSLKYVKTKKKLEITRRNSKKITQVLDPEGIKWLANIITIDAIERYQPLVTSYGTLEAGLSHEDILVQPFVAFSNKEAKQKVLIGINEVDWLLAQLKELDRLNIKEKK